MALLKAIAIGACPIGSLAHGQASDIPLQTYGDVSKYVVAGQAEKSRLYTFVQERQHHINNMAGPNHSTNDKLAIISDWINVDKAAE